MILKTACPLDCYDGCSMLATVENGQLKRLDGNKEHPITRGSLCNRGRNLGRRRDSADRILRPLKKVKGRFVEISWDSAIREITEEIRRTLSEVGHHGILHAYDWGSGAVLKNLNQRFFYQLGGCTETVGSLCWEAGLKAQDYDFGQARSHSPVDMAKHSSGIVVWGRNVATTNVHMMPFIKQAQARGAKLAVVNPTETDICRRADLCIFPRPGTDAQLALGVLRICRDRGKLNWKFLNHHAVGWDALSHSLDEVDIVDVVREAEVSVDGLEKLADFYQQSEAVTTLLGIGMQRYRGGGNAIRAIDALAAATGHVGRPGGGVNFAQRGISMLVDEDSLTGRMQADVREFSRTRQAEQIAEANPRVEMLFVTRTNPLTQVPDTAALRAAYEVIRCKVVIDTHMTKTAEIADYILPCTSVLEEEDVTFTTMWHPYVAYIQPVLPPRGEAKPDWLIFRDLAEALGMGDKMAGDVDGWLNIVLKPMFRDDWTMERLKGEGFMKLQIEDVPWRNKKFLTPSGKFEFFSNSAVHEGNHPYALYLKPANARGTDEYPYTLLTIHPRKHEHSQRHGIVQTVAQLAVDISAVLANEKNIVDGDSVRVWNQKASIVAIARVYQRGNVNTVKIESGWWTEDITANHFTDTVMADFGDQSAQYDTACNIERENTRSPYIGRQTFAGSDRL